MNDLVGAAAIVSFWIFLTIVSVAGIRYDYRKKQLAVDVLRHAVEHGQKLDPAVVDR